MLARHLDPVHGAQATLQFPVTAYRPFHRMAMKARADQQIADIDDGLGQLFGSPFRRFRQSLDEVVAQASEQGDLHDPPHPSQPSRHRQQQQAEHFIEDRTGAFDERTPILHRAFDRQFVEVLPVTLQVVVSQCLRGRGRQRLVLPLECFEHRRRKRPMKSIVKPAGHRVQPFRSWMLGDDIAHHGLLLDAQWRQEPIEALLRIVVLELLLELGLEG